MCIYIYKCVYVCVCVCVQQYAYMHACGDVWIGMGVIVYICMTIYMYMSTLNIKLMDVLIIYLISTFVHGFLFKADTPLLFRSL